MKPAVVRASAGLLATMLVIPAAVGLQPQVLFREVEEARS
jgi:hypothetical protein